MTLRKDFSSYHFPDFDAFRWIAFLLVFFQHGFVSFDTGIVNNHYYQVFATIKSNGHLGIDMFFVLSSFLITYKILEEYQYTSRFSLRNFLIRRTLRIWPLYFLVVLAGFSGAALLLNVFSIQLNLPPFQWMATFTVNYYFAFYGTHFLFFIVFLWSISVEEQFYIFWSVMLKAGKKIMLPVILLLALISVIYTYKIDIDQRHNLYFDTIRYLPLFAAGSVFAYISINKKQIFNRLISCPTWMIVMIYLAFTAILLFYHRIFSDPLTLWIEKPLIGLLFGFILFEQSFSPHSWFKLRSLKLAGNMGKISYGLYCFHGVALTLAMKSVLPINPWLRDLLLMPVFSITFTIIMSYFSYRYFESYFLRLKSKF